MIRFAFDLARFAVAMVGLLLWLAICIVGALLMIVLWPLFVIALFL